MSLAVESPVELSIEGSNWLPTLPLIGCRARQLRVTWSGGIKVVHEDVTASQVIPDSIQIIPSPYFQVFGRKERAAYRPHNQACHNQKDADSPHGHAPYGTIVSLVKEVSMHSKDAQGKSSRWFRDSLGDWQGDP
jgi:hypothetical protein